jgi:cytochrome c oxidase subunit III
MRNPANILLILLLIGISVLFFSLSISLVYTRVQNNLPAIKLPLIFYFNTLILLASSYAMVLAKKYYINDQTKNYINSLIAVLVLSILFLGAQFIGWNSLFEKNIFIHSEHSASYLYVISGLHFAHVIGGIPFLISFIITAIFRMKEPVSVLVYFSDPDKQLKLKLLSWYWHYLDALWIYLVLFFMINYLI